MICTDIYKEGLMPPLLVLQILSQNPKIPLSYVKDYISSCLNDEKKTIEENQRDIDACSAETEKMSAEIADLKNK